MVAVSAPWQPLADKLAREIYEATGGRPLDDYVADPTFWAAVTRLAAATHEMITRSVAAGLFPPADEPLRDYLDALETLVRIGTAVTAGTADHEIAAAWNSALERVIRQHGGLSDPREAPGDAGRVH